MVKSKVKTEGGAVLEVDAEVVNIMVGGECFEVYLHRDTTDARMVTVSHHTGYGLVSWTSGAKDLSRIVKRAQKEIDRLVNKVGEIYFIDTMKKFK